MFRSCLLLFALPLFAKVNFVREVKPILELHCVRCHGDERAMKGLRLNTRERALMAIVARKPEDSGLYLAAKTGYMPPGADKLSARDLETLRKWIEEGARWPKKVQLEAKSPFVK